MSDESFPAGVSERLAALPGVEAVTLGGSRTQGTSRPDSDWDFAIYYRGGFDPQHLRDVGWPGHVSELGEWGGGVFNGGAWLTIDGRRADVHYRDLAVIEHQLAEARAGRFKVEPLLFHLAGIPTYLVLAELALSRVLHGELPHPTYPDALRRTAPSRWWDRAARTFDYAIDHHAPAGRITECAGLLAQATAQSAHAILAGRGQWVTNEKFLIANAGLEPVGELLAQAQASPTSLLAVARAVREVCESAVGDVRPD